MLLIRRFFIFVIFALAAATLALAPFALSAAEASGRAAMQAVFDQFRMHPNQLAEVKLIIIDSSGRERTRYFRYLYKIFPSRTKSLIKFYKPPDVRGTGLLNESEDGSEDTDQWIYLPALRQVKKLTTSDKHKSFMGSDFTNADISGRQVDQDRHRIKSDDGEILVVVSTLKDKTEPYSRIETHILKKINVPRRVIFYDREGVKLKTLENQVLKKFKGMFTVMRSKMTNHRTQGASYIQKENFDISTVIGANEVGFKGLQR